MSLKSNSRCKLFFLNTEQTKRVVYRTPSPFFEIPVYEHHSSEDEFSFSICHPYSCNPLELINAVLMVNWTNFLNQAEIIFNKRAEQDKLTLEASVRLLIKNIKESKPIDVAINQIEDVVYAPFPFNDETSCKLFDCLKHNTTGLLTREAGTFICNVLNDLDSRMRFIWLTQMSREFKTSQWRRFLDQGTEERRIKEVFKELDSYLSKLGPRCQEYIDSFLTICSMDNLETPALRTTIFTEALSGPSEQSEEERLTRNHLRQMHRYSVFSERARIESQDWEIELIRDHRNPSFWQACNGLALIESMQILDKAKTSLSSFESYNAWNLIFSIDSNNDTKDEYTNKTRNSIYAELSKVYSRSRETGIKHAIDTTKMEAYLKCASGEGHSFNSYLEHKAIKDKWSSIFSLTEIEFISDFLYAILSSTLRFDFKFKKCKRCSNLFFYMSPNNQYCDRYYRGTSVVCSSQEASKQAHKKGGRELNGTIQKIKQRANNKRISEILKERYIAWAKDAHDLGMYYTKESSIDAGLWYQWLDLILPNKQIIDTATDIFPRMIIWNKELIDGNTIMQITSHLAKVLQEDGELDWGANQFEGNPKNTQEGIVEIPAAELQLACFKANAKQKTSKISVPGIDGNSNDYQFAFLVKDDEHQDVPKLEKLSQEARGR